MSKATNTTRTVEIKRLTHEMTANWLKMSTDELTEHMDFMEERRSETANHVVSKFTLTADRIAALGFLLFCDNALAEMRRCSRFIREREMEFKNQNLEL